MLRTQTWKPDTCTGRNFHTACVIEESYDDSIPPDQRVLSFVRFVRVCIPHGLIADPVARYAAVKSENFNKNDAIRKICGEVGDAGIDCDWEIDPDTRTLSVTEPPGLTPMQRLRLRAALGNRVNLRDRP